MSPTALAAVRSAAQKPRAHPALDRLQAVLLAVAALLTIAAVAYLLGLDILKMLLGALSSVKDIDIFGQRSY